MREGTIEAILRENGKELQEVKAAARKEAIGIMEDTPIWQVREKIMTSKRPYRRDEFTNTLGEKDALENLPYLKFKTVTKKSPKC